MGSIHYAWIIFAVTFITLLAASGTRSTPSVLMVPLEGEFGWSRGTVSLAVSINLVLFGFVGPFAAAMMDRWGIRPVVAGALVFIAAGAALTTLMNLPWQLYLLWGIVVGLGTGTMATVFAATVANRWFVKRRGLIVGLLTAASATGKLIFLPILGWMAQERGWRYVSLTVAIAFRGLAMASGNRNFWLLAGTFFISGASTNGLIGTHLIPASIDHGMAAVTAASLLAVIGIFDIAGTTISGALTDRVDSRKLLFAYYGLRGLSLLYLPVAFGSPSFALILFIVFYGLDWFATVPPTVAIASQTFGRASGPIVYGWIFTAHQLGAAVVASAAGVIRTVTGGYELAFIGSGLLCLVAAGLCLLMRRVSETESTTPLLPDTPLVRPAG